MIEKKKKSFDKKDIENLDKRFRTAFINSLSGFKSLALIGTKDKNNQTNLAVFNSLIHIGANPALVGFISRPGVVERQTLENIIETRFYTINHVTEDFYRQAHQTSARYPREVSEFDATGLTIEYKNDFFAPFVAESQVQIEVEFKEQVDLTINNTVLIIGEIQAVYFPADCLFEDGALDLEKAGSLASLGLDGYYKTQRLARLSYAKPDRMPEDLHTNYLVL
jgi:flavin reductase (DIM6/NTAB) family NADH-FMN oxidoreductase RutF